MKRRLAIAATLLSDAEIIILDEPTNGLDAMGIADVRNLIKRLHHEGKTIILASHILDEVEKVCTDVAILRKGVVINSGTVAELLEKEDILVVAAQNMEALKTAIRALYPAARLVSEDHRLELFLPKGEADLANINQFCYEKGIILSHLQLKTKSLETTFLELAESAELTKE